MLRREERVWIAALCRDAARGRGAGAADPYELAATSERLEREVYRLIGSASDDALTVVVDGARPSVPTQPR